MALGAYQQLGQRAEVPIIRLERTKQILGTIGAHLGGVEDDDVERLLLEARQQRYVVVTSLLEPNPRPHRVTRCAGAGHRDLELLQATRIKPKLERRGHDLTPEVAHERLRRALADVDRHRQEPISLRVADACCSLPLRDTTDESHRSAPRIDWSESGLLLGGIRP